MSIPSSPLIYSASSIVNLIRTNISSIRPAMLAAEAPHLMKLFSIPLTPTSLEPSES